jgi:hypothetical protein
MTKIYDFEDQRLIVDTDDWRPLIAMWGYKFVEANHSGSYRFEIFYREQDWAIYQPAIAGTDTELVYAYVPSREQVDMMLDFAMQMINPITALAQIRNMFNRPE